MTNAGGWPCPGEPSVAGVILSAAAALSVAGCSNSSAAPVPSTTTPSTPSAHYQVLTDHPGHGVIGQISAENGAVWTVTAPDGSPYAVTLTPDTHFGTPAGPRTAQQFPVGTSVRVTGVVTGHAVTAILITPVSSPVRAPSTPPTR